MNNVLTLKREIIGDSSYVPHLELYDAAGKPVNMPALYEDTLEAIQAVAHRIFQGYQTHAEGQIVQTLTERGLTVEGDAEAVSLETAGVDDDWDELMRLLIGAGAKDAVKPPIQRLMEKTTPDQVVELQQINQKLDPARQIELTQQEIQTLQKFHSKFQANSPISMRIEAFIQSWLVFHKPKLEDKGSEFFEACKVLAVLRHGIPTKATDDIELIKNMYKNLIREKHDNTDDKQ